jgi:hypothetical protein
MVGKDNGQTPDDPEEPTEPDEPTEPEDQAVDQIPGSEYENAKILLNGQILIIRGEKIYTLTGQQIR